MISLFGEGKTQRRFLCSYVKHSSQFSDLDVVDLLVPIADTNTVSLQHPERKDVVGSLIIDQHIHLWQRDVFPLVGDNASA